jgi:hypothetical protein
VEGVQLTNSLPNKPFGICDIKIIFEAKIWFWQMRKGENYGSN